ncbi:BTB/POZ domain-containing protein 3 [Liparis tanakae]|uniref:BTB/POZ domain-containing protein 3 n=1 Tax=Liparis tanakae TaxID=230148 RepID=A0A4Z2FIP4_9TELE|nr:BTB/POZ domain-containing protein 3 [Liparis tanakae]
MAAELFPTKKLVTSASASSTSSSSSSSSIQQHQQQNLTNNNPSSAAQRGGSWQGLFPTIRESINTVQPEKDAYLHAGYQRRGCEAKPDGSV